MRITNNMNTLNNLNMTSSNLKGGLSNINQTSNLSDVSKTLQTTSNNTKESIPSITKVEYNSTEKQQMLFSLQRDLNPTKLPTTDMMKTLSESQQPMKFSVISTPTIAQSVSTNSEPIIVKTINNEVPPSDSSIYHIGTYKPSEESLLEKFGTTDENEILNTGSDFTQQTKTSSQKSIEEFLKTNNIDESTMFDDAIFFG